MKRITILLFIFSFSLLNAFDKTFFSYNNYDNVSATGIGIIAPLDYKIIDNSNLNIELLTEYMEDNGEHMYVFSAQTLFDYYFNKNYFFEMGLGVAHFTKTALDKKLFGSNAQFKESIGFGYKFNKRVEATIKYTHYSNADLADKNSGLDFIGLRVIYKF
jgi:hypothetical protein